MPEMEDHALLTIDRSGRIVLPSSFRRALGLAPGDRVVAYLESDRVVLTRFEALEEKLWQTMGAVPEEEANG